MTRVLFLSRGRREMQFMRHLPRLGYEPVVLAGKGVVLAYASAEAAREVDVPLVIDVEQPAQIRRVPAAAVGLVVRTARAQKLVPNSSVVPDGFDPDDFAGPMPERDDGRFRIVVDGSAARLLEALDRVERDRRQLIELERASEADFRVADMLFLTTDDISAIPSRTYEYLAAGRPILAAVPEGEASELLEHAGTAHVCGDADVKGIAGAIDAELRRWECHGSIAHCHPAELEPHTWERVTERLASVFDAALGREHSERPVVERLVASSRFG
jgi:hypothetical protein